MWQYRYIPEMLNAYRRAFATLAGGGRVQMTWSSGPLDAAGFRREFIQALNRRINCKAGLDAPRGRKDCQEWQTSAYRDSRRIRDNLTRRIIVRQFETGEARARFSHLLFEE